WLGDELGYVDGAGAESVGRGDAGDRGDRPLRWWGRIHRRSAMRVLVVRGWRRLGWGVRDAISGWWRAAAWRAGRGGLGHGRRWGGRRRSGGGYRLGRRFGHRHRGRRGNHGRVVVRGRLRLRRRVEQGGPPTGGRL